MKKVPFVDLRHGTLWPDDFFTAETRPELLTEFLAFVADIASEDELPALARWLALFEARQKKSVM
jgi:hypothetical protein